MKQTAVQEMINIVQMDMNNGVEISMHVFMGMLEKAREKEINSKLKKQLFIGKVSEIIGFDKTVELLKECETAFKQQQ
jgi:hypothetical protein